MQGFPVAKKGQVVGLFGGSFDPPHAGHVHVTKSALLRFGLDQVWWLVSPGNPLKERAPASLEDRLAASKVMMRHPRVQVTSIETQMRTRYTAQTLRALQKRYPGVRFIWLMGADNLSQFHTWQDWEWIMNAVPIGVLARPGERISARMSKAGRIYRQHRLSGRASQLLRRSDAPTWCFINLPMTDISSTEIRARGDWTA